MSKARIVVPIRIRDGFRDVTAVAVHGAWAVHRCVDSPYREWTITHVPSGLRIPPVHTELLNKRKAIEVARRIADEIKIPKRFKFTEGVHTKPATKWGRRVVEIIHEVLTTKATP